MNFQILVAAVIGAWFTALGTGVWALIAVRRKPGWKRPRLALVLGLVTMAISLAGSLWLRLSYTETVNGSVRWNLDSRWLFLIPMLLGLLAIGLAIKGCFSKTNLPAPK